jgi:O-antigen ligase
MFQINSTVQMEPPVTFRRLRIPLAGPLALFLLGGLLGLWVAYDPTLSAPWLLWLAAGAGVYIAVGLVACTPQRLTWCASLIVAVTALAGLTFAAQYRHFGYEVKFGTIAWLGALTSAPFPRVISFPIHPNAAATFLAVALPLACGLTLATRGIHRVGAATAVLLIGIGVLLTASRGAWTALGTAGALALLPWLGRRAAQICPPWPGFRGSSTDDRAPIPTRGSGAMVIKRYSIPLLAIGALSTSLVILGFQDGSGATGWQSVFDSVLFRANDRAELYRNSLFLALTFPFSGIGPGGVFAMTYSHFQLLISVPYLTYTHNLFLAVWLAQGALGLAGFLSMIMAAGWRFQHQLQVEAGPVRLIRWGAMLGCTVALLHGLTDAPQYDTAWGPMLLVFAMLGVGLALTRPHRHQVPVWPPVGRTGWLTIAGVVLVTAVVIGPAICAAAAANQAALLQSRAALAPGLDPHQRQMLRQQAIVWANVALQIDPNAPTALARRGMLALDDMDLNTAGPLLERAVRRWPTDQATHKGLGYAFVWSGQIEKGVNMLRTLDRASEARQELDAWPVAWRERGREDLAKRAEQAAALFERR